MDDSGHRQDLAPIAGKGAPYGWRNGKYKHGMKGTPEWKAWVNARRRCTDPSCPDWPNYGGRGITMCQRGYVPGNVRWATRAEQNANRRRMQRRRKDRR